MRYFQGSISSRTENSVCFHQKQRPVTTSVLGCSLPTAHFPLHYLLHFIKFYMVISLPLPEGRAGSLGNFREGNFQIPFPILSSHCNSETLFASLSLSQNSECSVKKKIALHCGSLTEYMNKLCQQSADVLVSNLAVRTVTFLPNLRGLLTSLILN